VTYERQRQKEEGFTTFRLTKKERGYNKSFGMKIGRAYHHSKQY